MKPKTETLETELPKLDSATLSRVLSYLAQREKQLNKLCSMYSRTEGLLAQFTKQKENLRKQRRELISSYVTYAYAIDVTSVSVIQVSRRVSRYLRNTRGYFKNCNLLVAWSKTERKGYALYIDKTSQIRKGDLDTLLSKSSISSCYTDNRHRYIPALEKRYTQEIERLFSRVKRTLYPYLKSIQSWKKGKVYTEMSIQQLIEMYEEQFKKEGITFLNHYKGA